MKTEITIGSRVRVNLPSDPAVHDMDGEVTAIRAVPTGYVCGKPIQVAIEKRGGTKSWYSADELELLPAEESPDDLRKQADDREVDACYAEDGEDADFLNRAADEIRARAEELEREKRFSEICGNCGKPFGDHTGIGPVGSKNDCPGDKGTKFTPAQPKRGPTKAVVKESLTARIKDCPMDGRSCANEDAIEEMREQLAALTQERNQLAEQRDELRKSLLDSKRIMGCGYCGAEVARYDGPFPPSDEECARLIGAFAAHDRRCSRNPLAAEAREMRKQRDELAKAMEQFVETRNDIDDDTMEQWAAWVDESAPISQAEAQRHVDARAALARKGANP